MSQYDTNLSASGYDIETVGPNGRIIGWAIPSVSSDGGYFRSKANARLWAASPDLIEALKLTVERLEYLGEAEETWTKDARIAIAKAEDRSDT